LIALLFEHVRHGSYLGFIGGSIIAHPAPANCDFRLCSVTIFHLTPPWRAEKVITHLIANAAKTPRRRTTKAIAFSSEVGTGSRQKTRQV